jgi:hypothetical protein
MQAPDGPASAVRHAWQAEKVLRRLGADASLGLDTLFHPVALPLASLRPLIALSSVVLWAKALRKLAVRTARRHPATAREARA